ncbi:MAG: TRAP transporter substrate-binding protein DctP [Acidobacteria bacterium]|nr:TRAP transporter substrate-binding protein DctP [Acidobacteriota bacterium]
MRSRAAGVFAAGIAMLAFSFALRAPVQAEPQRTIQIRLGTLAPSGSSFHTAIVEMGQKWRDASGGSVKLIIYPDGTQGGEADMVRMMRAGILTAGMFTVVGLSEIDRSVGGLSFLPMTFRSWEEYDYVVEKLSPRLEKLLLDKGFVVLFWGDAGWVRFFSKSPAVRPDDFKQFKIFTWAGNAYQVDLMKALGYHPVPRETADILPGLKTDLINAIPLPPNQAMLGQCYTIARHMLALKWTVLSGAAIIRKDTWDKIPPDTQKKLRIAADAAGARIRAGDRKEDEESIAAMARKGLVVHQLTAQAEEEWQKLTKVIYPELRGKVVPADIFDEVLRLVAEFRAKGTSK